MPHVLVIGGGFAGVWAAAGVMRARREVGARAADVRVSLIDASDDMVIRPRLYEAHPEQMRVPLDRVLGPIGVRRSAATVTEIDTERRVVTSVNRAGETQVTAYDRLVLATGSKVIRPPFAGAEDVFTVDTLPEAAALEAHLNRLRAGHDQAGQYTAVVVGAGFTGLEVATELCGRLRAIAPPGVEASVVLVERADAVGPELGQGPRPIIEQALDKLGVQVRLGISVESVTPTEVRLSEGSTVAACTTVWTGGMAASKLTSQIPGRRDRLGRLHVDQYLRVDGVPDVYAAGDTAAPYADDDHVVTQSCQHAVPQGKFAGHNVGADLLGHPMVPFAPDPYVTCLDLGPAGAVLCSGWEREVVKSGDAAKRQKSNINAEWIYPPVDDGEKILDWADHRTTWPIEETVAAASV
ncbi:FAD-dependent oxidoreductase [Streptomyces sp. NPDC050625]|uniref:NAD(P)/FAD-dependent oxidoreductase n=1 Tax=Streptomyces sp. NPDC050625 TaxID=3154629 RepID=UPI003423724C